jgi:hypothetical protein
MEQSFNVFDALSFQHKDFCLSLEFKDLLERSRNAFIILFVGNSRAGKSQRLNQLLSKKLKNEFPFKPASGSSPITENFQVCGPLSFNQLAQIHQIDLPCRSNPDIFLIDCEGLNSLEKKSMLFRKGIFALTQLSSINIMVMKEQVNHERFEKIRSFFVVTKSIKGG